MCVDVGDGTDGSMREGPDADLPCVRREKLFQLWYACELVEA